MNEEKEIIKDPEAKKVLTSDTEKKKSNTNLFPLIGIVAILGLVIGIFWWNSKKSDKPALNTVNPTMTNSAVKNNGSDPNADKPPTHTDYPVGNAQTPSEAYRMLFAAVKSKDSAKIKLMLSKGSMGMAEYAAGMQKKTIEEVIRNGFSETTFADDFPQMRDERIKGGYGAVEVWNEKSKKWLDIPFVLEDGSWKIAFGDQFQGKWELPAKGMAFLEQENANANNPNLINGAPNVNGNFRGGGKIDKSKNK
jgi:hypothetical protein